MTWLELFEIVGMLAVASVLLLFPAFITVYMLTRAYYTARMDVLDRYCNERSRSNGNAKA